MTESDGPEHAIPATPSQRDDVVFRELGGDWVLFDPDAQRVHVLNLPAALVWTFCDGAHDEDALVDELSAAFESSPSRDEVQEHVRSSLEMLHHEGLLR